MEDATQASQPSSSPLTPQPTAAPPAFSIELIARSTAPLLLMVYGAGFVILGFHDARYGVIQFSPFRTRIVLVGLVFAVLVGVAALADPPRMWDPLESVRADTDPKRHFFRGVVLAAGFIFFASIMASLLSLFLFASVRAQQPSKWWGLLFWLAMYPVLFGVFTYINKIVASKPLRAAVLAQLAWVIFITVTINAVVGHIPIPFAQLAVFFASVGF